MEKPAAEALNDQAAAWFSRLHGADVPAADRAAFDQWMDDPANVVAYARVEATWERTERLGATSASGAARPYRPQCIIATQIYGRAKPQARMSFVARRQCETPLVG